MPTASGVPAGFNPNNPQAPGLERFPWVRPDSLELALMDATGTIHALKADTKADAQTEWLEKNKVNEVPQTHEVAYLSVKPAEGSRFTFPC